MAAAGLISAQPTFSGLRPVNLRGDLAQITDLIEVCFASTLDSGGRAALQNMRAVSRSGPLLWLLARMGQTVPFMQGFVWVEENRIVGNVSVSPAGYGNGWVIANVAVYPDYRQRGIARQLMQAALVLIDRQGKFATLQVDADNPPARHLYETLGFETQRTFIRWRRMSHLRLPDCLPEMPPVRRLARHEANPVYALANRVRPNPLGGMGWLHPTRLHDFRPSRLGNLRFWVSGQRSDFWIMPGDNGNINAALRIEHRLGSLTEVFDLLVSPEHQGQLEAPFINFALCTLIGRQRPLLTDHPADDFAASDVFSNNYFKPERYLVHMIRPVPQGKDN